MQLDVGTNHGNVQGFLKENGFTDDQIAQLSQHGGLSKDELSVLDRQLQAIPQATMDSYINGQLQTSLDRVDNLVDSLKTTNPAIASTIGNSQELQLALADYDNQFTISGVGEKSKPNTMLSYLEGHSVDLPGGSVKAGDPFTRTDIQNVINASKYGKEHSSAVHGREQRLVQALDALNIPHVPAQASTPVSPGQHHGVALREGDHSDAVRSLQQDLNQLHVPARGPLQEDGHFGASTKAVVEAFQREHHLAVDGRAGPRTLEAITDALKQQPSSRIDDQAHPGNALYQQARDAVHRLDAQHGRIPDQSSDNLAAAVAVSAHNQGLSRIDQVLLGDDASQAWAVQGDLRSPFKQYASVDVDQAVRTPMEQSSASWNHHLQTQDAPVQAAQQTQLQNAQMQR